MGESLASLEIEFFDEDDDEDVDSLGDAYDEGDQASIGYMYHNQINQSKILALQKMKKKKLKKRLSLKH